MNRPLRRMAAIVMVLFGLLLVNVTWIQAFQAPELRTREGNSRTVLEEYERERGEILVAGLPVAQSVETEGALRFLRQYSEGPLYAHVTGYYSIVYGATQIERAAGPVLSGEDPRLFVRRLGDLLTGEAIRGGTVGLTLDPEAQRAAAAGLGDRKGSVVALDPATGAVLAMVSRPTYDPNVLTSHDTTAITEAYQALDGNPDQPLLNRAVSRTYPPGSTFKIVTLAAALSRGYTVDGDVPGPAALDLPQSERTLPNWDGQQCTPGSDTTTLERALARSCNSTFGAIGIDLGAEVLQEQAQAFGFGADLDIPIPVAPSEVPEELDAPQTALSSIGQFDVRATPLQMAMVAAGIANNGLVMRPYLVAEVLSPDTTLLERTEPEELSRAVEPQVAAQVRDLMVGVVEDGTGSNAAIGGVSVAGKTGTAQQGEDRPPHAWFVSFAPADDPQVAVAVVLEDGGGEAEVSGNRLAAPIARDVMAAVLGGDG